MKAPMLCNQLDRLPDIDFQAVIIFKGDEICVNLNYLNKPDFTKYWVELVATNNNHAKIGDKFEIVATITAKPKEIKAKVKELKAQRALRSAKQPKPPEG